MLQRPAPVVNLPNEHRIKFPAVSVGHQSTKSRPGIFRARNSAINIFLRYLSVATRGILTKL
jgi:hypothetical protein